MTKDDKKLIKKFLEKRVNIYNRLDEGIMQNCFTEGLKVKNREIKKLKEQIEKMKCCENCRHYFDEPNTDKNCNNCDDSLSSWEMEE